MRVHGLGVDIVALARMERLLKAHPQQAWGRILTEREQAQVQDSSKLSTSLLSKVFSAKEAFFKALGGKWMGAEGFRAMEVSDVFADTFSIRLLERRDGGPDQGCGCFYETDQYVGAQVIVYEMGTAGRSLSN